ncbi:MAG: methyltransferase [Planctomycetaceae bacterium]|nr:methyltransferase [Planctomycetaceae bacterium]
MNNENLHEQMSRMIMGYSVSQAIHAACKLGIADRLKQGPKSVTQLAEEADVHEDALFRLLRALASLNIFAEGESRVFALTPLAELLRPDSPDSLQPLALMMGSEIYRTWGNLTESITSGQTAFDEIYGEPFFDYLTDHPESARIFDAAMTASHGHETEAILEVYDFAHIGTLADVGGGNGSKLVTILEHHPTLNGILFDLPHVVERAKETFQSAGLNDRCQIVGGDFFQSIPPGADAYLMRHIIHDWDDEKCLKILRNCHDVMPRNGKLLIVENVILSGNAPCSAKFLDLTMLLVPGGRERTESEFRELFAKADFELTRVIPGRHHLSVIEGIRRDKT